MVGKFHDSIREGTNAIKNTKSIMARESRRANAKYAQKAITKAILSRNEIISKAFWKSAIPFSFLTGASNMVNSLCSNGWNNYIYR